MLTCCLRVRRAGKLFHFKVGQHHAPAVSTAGLGDTEVDAEGVVLLEKRLHLVFEVEVTIHLVMVESGEHQPVVV